MKNKDRKKIKILYAKKNIDFLFNLLENKFRVNFNKLYIKDIKNLSQSFNLRLTRQQKLKFCKKCETYFDINTLEIRFNSSLKTKDYICKNCNFVKRIKY